MIISKIDLRCKIYVINIFMDKDNLDKNTLRSQLNAKKENIQYLMSNLGNLNQTEIDKEFMKIDKQLDRRDIYIYGFQSSTKKPEYNNIDYLLNGVNVGKLISVSISPGGEGSMDYIFNFKFDEGESNEDPFNRSNDIIIPLID